MHKQKNSTVSSNLPFIMILSLCFSLIFTGCIDNKKKSENIPTPVPTPEVTKTGSGISSSSFIDPVVEKAYRRHSDENACGSMPLASVEIYNLAYEKMQWISEKRKLSYIDELFPALCTPSQENYAADRIINANNNKQSLIYYGEKLKAMGLFPVDIDFFEDKVKRLKNSSLGYYVPDTNILTVATDKQDKAGFESTFVHELVHALQEQHYPSFKMNSPFDERKISDDEFAARTTLYEGEATLTQMIYEEEVQGKSLPSNEFIIEEARKNFSESKTIPYHMTSYYLEYEVSVPFFRTVMGSDYSPDGIERLFENPPDSTEQIYSPEKYLKGEKGHFYNEFDLAGYDSIFSDHKRINSSTLSLGEIGLLTLLRTYDKTVDLFETAAGWDGDRVLLYAKDDDFNWWDTTFIHLGKWDSFEDADNFSKLLRTMIVNKYGDKIELISPDESSFQIYVLNEEGDRDLIIIGQKADRTILVERITLEKARELSYLGDSKILDFLNERG